MSLSAPGQALRLLHDRVFHFFDKQPVQFAALINERSISWRLSTATAARLFPLIKGLAGSPPNQNWKEKQ